MIYFGRNYKNVEMVYYSEQPLRGYWYSFMQFSGLLAWWNNLKQKEPGWQILEYIVDPWHYIYQ